MGGGQARKAEWDPSGCSISSKVQLFPCSINMFSEGKRGKNLNNNDKDKYRLSSLGPMVISCIFPAVLWQ